MESKAVEMQVEKEVEKRVEKKGVEKKGVEKKMEAKLTIERPKDKEKRWLRVKFSGVSRSMAWTIGQYCQTAVPMVAIDGLKYETKGDINISGLHCDMLLHSLKMIPIFCHDFNTLKFPEDCTCENQDCGQCTAQIRLEAQGPCFLLNTSLVVKKEDQIKIAILPTTKPIHFGTLFQDQVIRLTLLVRKGVAFGDEPHFKATENNMSMKATKLVLLDKKIFKALPQKEKELFINCCPKKVFQTHFHEKKGDIEDFLPRQERCNQCGQCTDVATKKLCQPLLVKIKEEEPWEIKIEPQLSTTSDRILFCAFDVLLQRLQKVIDTLVDPSLNDPKKMETEDRFTESFLQTLVWKFVPSSSKKGAGRLYMPRNDIWLCELLAHHLRLEDSLKITMASRFDPDPGEPTNSVQLFLYSLEKTPQAAILDVALFLQKQALQLRLLFHKLT
jgi:hypothetical protein